MSDKTCFAKRCKKRAGLKIFSSVNLHCDDVFTASCSKGVLSPEIEERDYM